MQNQLYLCPLEEHLLEECVDLFIDTFTREPWNDVYSSREQVRTFFKNHMGSNYYLGFALKAGEAVVALSIGMKKPWIEGMEYYIDQFCVKSSLQRQGIGSRFLSLIEAEIQTLGMNAMLLNTEKGYPSQRFYIKNGFHPLEELVVLAR